VGFVELDNKLTCQKALIVKKEETAFAAHKLGRNVV
jgi:hypothetical protein